MTLCHLILEGEGVAGRSNSNFSISRICGLDIYAVNRSLKSRPASRLSTQRGNLRGGAGNTRLDAIYGTRHQLAMKGYQPSPNLCVSLRFVAWDQAAHFYDLKDLTKDFDASMDLYTEPSPAVAVTSVLTRVLKSTASSITAL